MTANDKNMESGQSETITIGEWRYTIAKDGRTYTVTFAGNAIGTTNHIADAYDIINGNVRKQRLSRLAPTDKQLRFLERLTREYYKHLVDVCRQYGASRWHVSDLIDIEQRSSALVYGHMMVHTSICDELDDEIRAIVDDFAPAGTSIE